MSAPTDPTDRYREAAKELAAELVNNSAEDIECFMSGQIEVIADAIATEVAAALKQALACVEAAYTLTAAENAVWALIPART